MDIFNCDFKVDVVAVYSNKNPNRGVVTSIFYFISRNVAPGKSDLSSVLAANGIHVVHEYTDIALVMPYQFKFT